MKSFTFHSLMKCKGFPYQKTVRAAQTVPVPQKEEEIPITSDFFLFHFLYDRSGTERERKPQYLCCFLSLFLSTWNPYYQYTGDCVFLFCLQPWIIQCSKQIGQRFIPANLLNCPILPDEQFLMTKPAIIVESHAVSVSSGIVDDN